MCASWRGFNPWQSASAMVGSSQNLASPSDEVTCTCIRAYLQAEAADPALPALQKKLAVCYQQQGDTQAAKARYQRYLATDPPDAAKVRLILENLQ